MVLYFYYPQLSIYDCEYRRIVCINLGDIVNRFKIDCLQGNTLEIRRFPFDEAFSGEMRQKGGSHSYLNIIRWSNPLGQVIIEHLTGRNEQSRMRKQSLFDPLLQNQNYRTNFAMCPRKKK